MYTYMCICIYIYIHYIQMLSLQVFYITKDPPPYAMDARPSWNGTHPLDL